VIAVALIFWQMRWPARQWPDVSGWVPRALFLTALQPAAAWASAAALALVPPLGLLDIGVLGLPWNVLAGFLIVTFVSYWWHRAKHAVPPLWRWLHQIHHSPSRIEALTAFYRHPVEVIVNTSLLTFIVQPILGLDAETAQACVLLVALADLFYHSNISTPRWIGRIIQRPEAHCEHHRIGQHAFNYGDIPLWDILFGTYLNPREFTGACGFRPGTEERLGALLAGRDLSAQGFSGSDGRVLSKSAVPSEASDDAGIDASCDTSQAAIFRDPEGGLA
jgi:sterol desaturase/sphingolipid hydroxylase (fatty acid hydroxylase superfamily)